MFLFKLLYNAAVANPRPAGRMRPALNILPARETLYLFYNSQSNETNVLKKYIICASIY